MAEDKRVALITGSGRRRVGNVVARHLAKQGYAIAIHYHRSEEAARETVEALREGGCDCEAFRANVVDERDVANLFEKVSRRFGRLDVLVTTASIWEGTRLEETSSDDLVENFKVNTLGTFHCARHAGMIMCKQDEGGVIVTFGDWAVERPYLDHAAYFISKGAIPTLTRTLAVELGHRNPKVRVNCIHPGPIMFPPDADEEEREALRQSTLTKSGDCPEAVAHAVQFFVENEFVTGTCLPVDGGRSTFSSESTGRKRPI